MGGTAHGEALTAGCIYIVMRYKSTAENDQKSVTNSAAALPTDDGKG
jgi:hypothetical protein